MSEPLITLMTLMTLMTLILKHLDINLCNLPHQRHLRFRQWCSFRLVLFSTSLEKAFGTGIDLGVLGG